MTRTEARRRRRRRQQIRRGAAWALLITVELIVAAAPTAVLAAILLPFAYAERGYMAVGGEWLAILITFCAAYSAVHNKICDKLQEE